MPEALAPSSGVDGSKFRLLRCLPDGTVRRGGLELLEAGGGLLWVDLIRQGPDELALLAKRFNFHPLAIEDCLHLDQRPKLDAYDDHLFVVQHGFSGRAATAPSLTLHELHAFLGKDYLVTVHADPMPELDEIFLRTGTENGFGRGPDFWLYRIADALVESHFRVLDELSEAIETLEEEIVSQPWQRRSIDEIFALKRALVNLRRTISPARDLFALLAKRGGDELIHDKTAPYFRDVYDHLVRVHEAIDIGRDLLGNALEAHLSNAANRTNEIVKQLTIFSAIFLPLSFIVGFFGQNFTDILPFGSQALFWTMIGACALLPVGMLGWFWHKGWF